MKPQATEQYSCRTVVMTEAEKDQVCDVLIAILERLLAKGEIDGDSSNQNAACR